MQVERNEQLSLERPSAPKVGGGDLALDNKSDSTANLVFELKVLRNLR